MNKNCISIGDVISIAKEYHDEYDYTHGGCYIFAKILAHVFNGEVYINRSIEHCACKINDKLYDINGVLKQTDGFKSFRPKEENRISAEYFIISHDYTKFLMNAILQRIEEASI